jgi:type I restriction enzyme, S subunit
MIASYPWKTVPFESGVTELTGGQPKVQRQEYLTSGSLPVIDQGQEPISGYTNDCEMAYKGPLPVVLFGDHTRIFKYVDFPFALGADGVKVLVPKKTFNPKFLFFYFQSVQIPSRGYSRHFKFLREVYLPCFPLSEQRRIVEILDQADALRKKRAEADTKAKRILPSLFYKMFGNPAMNPRMWDGVPLKKLLRNNQGALQSGPFGSNLHNSDFVDDGPVLVVGIDNVHDSGFQIGRDRRITWEKYEELRKYKLEAGDVLITIMGTVGRSCVFPNQVGEAICTKHVYRIQTDRRVLDPEYLCASFKFSPSVRVQLGSSITGQIVDAITSRNLKELIVDVPPIDLQRRFAQHKQSVDDDALRRNDSRSKFDSLFDVLLYRAFSGYLTATWRESHMKELLAEMEEQAKYLGAHRPNGQRENAALQESLF